MTASDLQRWSRDVAEDPGSPSFVPLARAYRRQGRKDAAMAVLLRGLERNPEHVEAHALLALLHVDAGDRQKAGDEWAMILRFEPGNFEARRGLGFLALERGDLDRARGHLEAAAGARPGDPTVTQALDVLDRRQGRTPPDRPAREDRALTRPADRPPHGEPRGASEAAARPEARREPGEARPEPRRAPPPDPGRQPAGSTPDRPGAGAPAADRLEPERLFAPLAREAPFLGALLLDKRGLVLAGSMVEAGAGDGEALGALLSPAVGEALRTVELLQLGGWDGMLLDCEGAFLHIAPVSEGVVLLAARGGAPAGWVVRTARRARELATRFLEGTA